MGKKILIIDDDADLSKEMADILKDEGYFVDVRLYDLEGLPQFKPHSYDIIIMDFKMPGLTGTDILKAIPDAYPGPKVLVLSGRPFVEKALKEEGLHDKVTAVIQKPFSIQDLLNKINSL